MPKAGTCQIYKHFDFESNKRNICWVLGVEEDAHNIRWSETSGIKCGEGVNYVFGFKDGKPAISGHEAWTQDFRQ